MTHPPERVVIKLRFKKGIQLQFLFWMSMHGVIRIFQDSYWPAVIFRALQIFFETGSKSMVF